MDSRNLPLQRSLARAYTLTGIVVVLMAGVSLAGLLFTGSIYPTDALREAYLINDAINLLIGVPVLLGSMGLTRKGKLAGLLLWPGALFYSLYNYIAYVFGIPFGGMTFAYFAIVLLSIFAIYDLLARIDQEQVRERLTGVVPVKIAGVILAGFGVLFLLRAASQFAPAVMGQAPIAAVDTGVLIADMLLSITWIAGGILLLLKNPLGYTSGLGLLFGGSMLFIGLVLLLLLQPLFLNMPVSLMDVAVVLVMGLIFFVPFGLYLRGVLGAG